MAQPVSAFAPKVQVSSDGLEATMTFKIPDGKNEVPKFTAAQLLGFLNNANVSFGIDQEMLAKLADSPIYGRPIKVATGTPQQQGTPGYYEYLFDTNFNRKPTIRPDGTADYMSIKTIETVQEGDVIATYHPAVQGSRGMSVRGQILEPKPVRDLPPLIGRGFDRSSDNLTYTAKITGKIEVNQGKILVSPVHEVQGDVGIETGNIKFNGDVIVHGGVHDGAVIDAAGNVIIHGLIEDCDIRAGKDLFLLSGIKGNEKTVIDCKGSITAQFVEYAIITCSGNITADYFFKSKISCDGHIELNGNNASIIGGYVSAVQGVEVNDIGNSFGTITNVSVGVDVERAAEYEMLAKKIMALTANVQKIKKGIEDFDKLGEERGINVKEDPRRMQLLRVRIRDEAIVLEETKKLNYMKEVIMSGKGATIKVYRRLYAGSNLSVDDHHASINENHEAIEIEKSEEGIRLVKIRG
ncbi:FapA family protein [Pseudobutyrivibrio ruminis]|uniref:FapA family protein n=1 Tax=Pseudobutyrivibrio ruminis TaxID=46206 RepID=UPI00068A893D|nr:FapA family protein [Pseudobutyrivibrio ruminis]